MKLNYNYVCTSNHCLHLAAKDSDDLIDGKQNAHYNCQQHSQSYRKSLVTRDGNQKNHSFNINKRVIWQSESKYRALPAHTRTHTYVETWHSIFLTWQRILSISICLIIFILSRWTFKFTVPITSKNCKIHFFCLRENPVVEQPVLFFIFCNKCPFFLQMKNHFHRNTFYTSIFLECQNVECHFLLRKYIFHFYSSPFIHHCTIGKISLKLNWMEFLMLTISCIC